jgi:hypothetical protein
VDDILLLDKKDQLAVIVGQGNDGLQLMRSFKSVKLVKVHEAQLNKKQSAAIHV